MADWLTCRRRIAANIAELSAGRSIDTDQRLWLAYEEAWKRGEALLNWGWVWTL